MGAKEIKKMIVDRINATDMENDTQIEIHNTVVEIRMLQNMLLKMEKISLYDILTIQQLYKYEKMFKYRIEEDL